MTPSAGSTRSPVVAARSATSSRKPHSGRKLHPTAERFSAACGAEYHDENLRLPKNSSVVVKRVPSVRAKVMVGGAPPPTRLVPPPASHAAAAASHPSFPPARSQPTYHAAAAAAAAAGGDAESGDAADDEIAAFMSSTGERRVVCARVALPCRLLTGATNRAGHYGLWKSRAVHRRRSTSLNRP
jgi:hypothetical protein